MELSQAPKWAHWHAEKYKGNEIKNLEALANPEILNQYRNFKELND